MKTANLFVQALEKNIAQNSRGTGKTAHYASLQKEARAQKNEKTIKGNTEAIKLFLKLAKFSGLKHLRDSSIHRNGG